MRNCIGRKGPALVQLLAMLSLHLMIFLPLISHTLAARPKAGGCFHDHSLCGCAPERIASRTCCCAQSVSSCCMAAENGDMEENDKHPRAEKSGRHYVKMPPCGGASPLFTASAQDCAYLPFTSHGLAGPGCDALPFFEDPLSVRVRFDPPPHPPPEFPATA